MGAGFVTDIRQRVEDKGWVFSYGSDVYAYTVEQKAVEQVTLFLLSQETANTREQGAISEQVVTARLLLTMPGDTFKTFEGKFDDIILALYSLWDDLLIQFRPGKCQANFFITSDRITEVADWGPQKLDGLQITATFNQV